MALLGLIPLPVGEGKVCKKEKVGQIIMSAKAKKKGPLRLLNPMRDGRGVEKGEDTTPGLKYFFKLLGRKFWKLVSVNLLILVQYLPPIACAFVYLSGPQAGSQQFSLYPTLLGAQTASPTVTGTTLFSLFSKMGEIDAYDTYVWWVIGVVALLYVITYGWQKVGTTYIMRGLVKGDGVFILSDFAYAIRRNLKQGFLLGLLDCLVIFALIFDFVYFYNAAPTGLTNFMYIMIVALLIIWCIMRFYIYTMLVTFDMSIRKILKNALIFTALGIKRNLMALLGIVVLLALCVALCVVCISFGIYGAIIIPFLFAPAILSFMYNYASWPVIQRYMIDPVKKSDTEEEDAPEA